jgi:hypothetical protein
MYSLKEQAIRDYLGNVNWKRDNWSYSQLEEGMRRFLGERPSMEINYKKDVMVNEISGESKEIKRLESILVVFTDTDDKIKKIKIMVD